MIFVTVGTHEQQFDRLIQKIDELKRDGVIKEEVLMQTGYSTYEPQYCTKRQWLSYTEMNENIQKARIVITHGGPSSFVAPLQVGKTPIVVPREATFGEHVNNHQKDFCKAVAQRHGTIILVEDINQLGDVIERYDEIVKEMPAQQESNNKKFCENLSMIVDDMF